MLAFLSTSQTVWAQRSLGDLTGPWQLFVDDYHVQTKSNVTRTYHPFEKYAGNPVLTPTKAWEDSIVYIYGTVLPNESGSGYRMWYHTMRPEDTNNDGSNILYATSPDGINWTKPNLYINSWHGSAANNMIFDRPTTSGITSVMHTPFDPDPNKRYKLFNYEPGCYYGAWSADGMHTTDLPNNPILTGVGDVAMASWDPHTQQYLGYAKINTYVNGLKRRSVALTTSSDFQTWSTPQLVLEPDTFDDRWAPAGTLQCTHFYGLCTFAYESMYMGILWIFRATEPEGYTIGPVYAEIVSSHDGINWTREEGNRPAMLPLGPPGAWDDGQLYTAIAPIYHDGKLAIYYGACDDVHGTATKKLNCNIGLATLRKDGFASLGAGSTVGSVTTKDLLGLSGELHVNYQSNGGWVKVEVLDANNTVVPGYSQADCLPLTGDSIDEVVVWNGQTDLPTGISPLRLRFVMQNASIYSFKTATPVVEPPVITLQPVSQSLGEGATATFTIQATGSVPLTYQWQKNGANLVNGGHYAGATTPSLTVSNINANDAGLYACVVTNAHGTATSNAANLGLAAVQFLGLGTGTTVTGVSADGAIVCGTTSNGRPFIWTAAGGLKDLGLPSGATTASAVGVGTYNGNVVVAIHSNASFRAKRWEGNTAGVGTFTNLPKLNGTLEWTATGLGSSGSDYWISGSTIDTDGTGRRAVRYARSSNTTVSFSLPTDGHHNSDFHAVADNGFAGGQYQYKGLPPGGGARNAMTYMGGSQCAPLNTLFGTPATTYEAIVKAMSRDGQSRGGWSYYPGGVSKLQPVVWRNSTTPTAVPFLPGGDGDNNGEILALNGDGTLAGGYSYYKGTPDGPSEALIWDPTNGTRQYQSVLTGSYGLNLSGWSLQNVRSISSSGQTVVGNASHNGQAEGWVVAWVAHSAPVVSTHPLPQEVCPGSPATFAVVAGGAGPFAYQWQYNGTNVSDGSYYSGTTTSVLTVLNANVLVQGDYRCVVTSLGGGAVSNAAALSLKATGPHDFDGDCDVDLDDLAILAACTTGPGHDGSLPAGCIQAHFDAADHDGDGDVDQTDFGVFQRCYRGADQEIEAGCAE